MNQIWANRIIDGDRTFSEVPTYRKNGVKDELKARVVSNQISAERYKQITGEDYTPATPTASA